MSTRKLVIVDPCLKDFVGHHFEYDHAVAAEAAQRGFDVTVLSHRDVDSELKAKLTCTPVFRDSIWQTQKLWSALSPECGAWNANRRFYRDLCRGMSHAECNSNSIVFAHMITARQLLAWAWWCERVPPKDAPQVVLLLRYQAAFYDDPISQRAFQIIERAARTRPIRFATDSSRLADDFSSLTSLPFEVLAIPHTCKVGPTTQRPASSSRPLRIVSLGNARDEKGFFEIIKATKLLAPDLEGGRIELILQCNNPWPDELTVEIEAFARDVPKGVTLLRQPLDTEAYYDVLNQADIVLLPYWRSIYVSRTSGVFVEALAAGKPVIVTDDTWMSDCLSEHGAGVVCKERDHEALVAAIHHVVDDFSKFARAAQAESAGWLEFHSPATIIDQLVRKGAGTARRAAVLYPWGNLYERNSGAAVRTGLLLDYLKTQFDEILVFQTATSRTEIEGNVRWESYVPDKRATLGERISRIAQRKLPPIGGVLKAWGARIGRRVGIDRLKRVRRAVGSRIRAVKACGGRVREYANVGRWRPVACRVGARSYLSPVMEIVGGLLLFVAGTPEFVSKVIRRGPRAIGRRLRSFVYRMTPKFIRERRTAGFMLVQHQYYKNNAEFAYRMREIADWADVVFLDYTFWGAILAPQCRTFGAKLVISDLDVVADQSKAYPVIHRLTLAAELAALADCDHAISVSPDDQATFARCGVKTTMIPNPIDIGRCVDRMAESDVEEVLKNLLGPEFRRPVCLFVGSDHPPNIRAARWITEIAQQSDSGEVLYVIAGVCAPVGRTKGCVRLGRVSSEELAALYQRARVVINPVTVGTGTAIKTLEAMACGKVLVATSVGVRGLEIEDDVHGVICNDLAAYPKLIAELIADHERCRRISEAAQEFAAGYDYRIVYERYMQLLEAPADASTIPLERVAA